MIGYVTIGANDIDKSGQFYDAVFGVIGGERKFKDGNWIGYGMKGDDKHAVYVCPPFDGQPARHGNGIMIGIQTKTREQVNAAHDIALKNGGSDEGRPGPRPEDSKTFYGAYMRDPVGNKICIYCRPNQA